MSSTPSAAVPASRWSAARSLALMVALVCTVGGAWLSVHHPLSAPLALLLFSLAAAGALVWPAAWLVGLPPLVSCLGLALWSGWIVVEETDLLVLAVAAGGYARWGLTRGVSAGDGRGQAATVGWLLVLLWMASLFFAAARGIADAGGLALDWYGDYRGPMNALRLAKPAVGVALLLPLWLRLAAEPRARAVERLTLGLALAHAVLAAACLWERAAYPGLLDFSTDYRTTGPFWEMHVGGAALDGMLALTMPFAIRLWWSARQPLGWALAAAIVIAGAYAVLTTFSRILLLAVPLGIAVLLLAQLRSRRGDGRNGADASKAPSVRPAHWAAVGLLCVTVVGAAAWLFPVAGYRGMLALLGDAALLLLLGPKLRQLRRRDLWIPVAALLVAGPAALAGALLLPKGPYLALAVVLSASGAVVLAQRGRPAAVGMATGGFVVALACTVWVAWHWGGPAALSRAWPVALVLALALGLCALLPAGPWPDSPRWQGRVLVGLVTAAVVVGLFGGGAYMGGRIGGIDADTAYRLQHWRGAASRLSDPESLWLGRGLGRFLDWYATGVGQQDSPGDVRRIQADGRPAMRLVAGTNTKGWPEPLLLSQRIDRPLGTTTLRLTVRSTGAARLAATVCRKHLLYAAGCQSAGFTLPAGHPDWQTFTVKLAGDAMPEHPWYLSGFTVFSVMNDSPGQPVELRAVSLTDGSGTELLQNGRFEQDTRRWFFSSDAHHMPWHAKNIVMHLLFEQGIVGLAVMSLLTLVALGRLLLGGARHHPLAPALAAAVVGFWAVGMVDSLLDMPRVALLAMLLTAIAVTLQPRRMAAR